MSVMQISPFYRAAAEAALEVAMHELERAQASLSGAGMACFITWQEQERAIQGEKLKVDIATEKVAFLKRILT